MFREFEVKTVEIPNGETIAYREVKNDKKTLVLIHGNMSSSMHYDVLMEKLENDYHLIAVDLRGFGDSSFKKEINSLKDFSDDVQMLLDHLNVQEFSVMGWSTGGGVALELAASLKERVSEVILMDSVGIKGYPMFKKDASGQPILTELITTKEEIANDFIQVTPILDAYKNQNKEFLVFLWNAVIYTNNQPVEERYQRYLDAMLKQRNLVDVDYSLVHFNMTNHFNGVNEGTNRIADITAKILILHGANDLVVPVEFAYEMKNYFKEQAEIIVLENCGHSPITDDLDQVVEVIRNFI